MFVIHLRRGWLVQKWDKMKDRMWVKDEVLGRWVAGKSVFIAREISTNVQHFSTAITIHPVDGGALNGGWEWQF